MVQLELDLPEDAPGSKAELGSGGALPEGESEGLPSKVRLSLIVFTAVDPWAMPTRGLAEQKPDPSFALSRMIKVTPLRPRFLLHGAAGMGQVRLHH